MSEIDSEDSESRGRLDLESNNPQYSLVDSTMDLTQLNNREFRENDWPSRTTYRRSSTPCCFNTTINLSADQNAIRHGVITDNNISGPAPNTSTPVCYAPPVEAGPRNNGSELLEPPILTTPPRINSWSPFQYGGIEVEGSRKSTLCFFYFNLIKSRRKEDIYIITFTIINQAKTGHAYTVLYMSIIIYYHVTRDIMSPTFTLSPFD